MDSSPDPTPEPDLCAIPCPGLQTCDEETGDCIEPPICLADIDCFEGRFCFETRCASGEEVVDRGGCTDDASCEALGEFLFCNLEGHHCIPSGRCNTDDQCPGPQRCASDGLCRPCTEDEHCDGDLTCDSLGDSPTYTCLEPGNCEDESACRGDRVCLDTQCTEPECDNDVQEPNEHCLEATEIFGGAHPDLAICEGECDWFSLDIEPGDGFVARVSHTPAEGDLDLFLYEGPCEDEDPGRQVTNAATLDANEVVAFPRAYEASRFYMAVCPFISEQDGGTNRYDLEVHVVEGGFCFDDLYDEGENTNDEPTGATTLSLLDRPFEFAANSLQVCPDAPDWYRLDLNEGEFFSATIELNGAFGDLDLCVFDGLPLNDQAPAIVCTSGNNNTETIAIVAERTGPHYLYVHGPETAQNAYALRIEINDTCTDRLEPNDQPLSPARLDGPAGREVGLQICGESDEDWFSASLGPEEALIVSVTYDADALEDLSALLFRSPSDPTPTEVFGVRGLLSFALPPDTDSDKVLFALSALNRTVYTLDYEVTPLDLACPEDDLDNRSIDTAMPTPFSVRATTGYLCPSTTDHFRLTVPDNTDLFVQLQEAPSSLALDLLDSNGQPIAESIDEGFGRIASLSAIEGQTIIAAISGLNERSAGPYLLNITTQTIPEGLLCPDDILEPGTNNPDRDNDGCHNPRTVRTESRLTNLMLCPLDRDFYSAEIISGHSISIRLTATDPRPGALKARLYDPFCEENFPFTPTIESEGGRLNIDIDAIEVLIGGLWTIEIFSEAPEPIWYDLTIESR